MPRIARTSGHGTQPAGEPEHACEHGPEFEPEFEPEPAQACAPAHEPAPTQAGGAARALPPWRFGAHVSRVWATGGLADNLTAAAAALSARARAAGEPALACRAAQVFLVGPRSSRALVDAAGARAVGAAAAAAGLELVVHSSYLSAPFGAAAKPAAAALVRSELALAAAAGAAGLVVHAPAVVPTGDGDAGAGSAIAAVVAAWPRLGPGAAPYLYVETAPFQKAAVVAGRPQLATPAAFAALLDAVDITRETAGGPPAGVCVDTAHVWAAGIDLASEAAADAWCRELEARLGRRLAAAAAADRPSPLMWHLNDSVMACGAGRDEHASLGHGAMWPGAGPATGLVAVLASIRRTGTTAIFERHGATDAGLRALLVRDFATVAGLSPHGY